MKRKIISVILVLNIILILTPQAFYNTIAQTENNTQSAQKVRFSNNINRVREGRRINLRVIANARIRSIRWTTSNSRNVRIISRTTSQRVTVRGVRGNTRATIRAIVTFNDRTMHTISRTIRVNDLFYEQEMPLLVNRDNPIPRNWNADLVSIGDGHQLNRRAARAWRAMRNAAREEGISLWIISAYRNNARQTRNFNNRVSQHRANGRSAEEAFAMTAVWIAVPGTSEHETGLAIDLNSLNQSFERTREFRWLQRNAARFGFIMRYPRNKTRITGINYEPWHYRYVGSNHARRINRRRIVLEQYIENRN